MPVSEVSDDEMDDLLTYLMTRNRNGDFGAFVDAVGERTAYVVATEIASWLQRQKRNKHNNPLKLDSGKRWCADVMKLLTIDPSLADIFEVCDDAMRFKETASVEQRNAVRELVDSRYHPVLRG